VIRTAAVAVRAIELRSEELGKLCQSATLSLDLYIGHCGPKRAEDHSIAADLRAVKIRGPAIDQVAKVRATPTSAGFVRLTPHTASGFQQRQRALPHTSRRRSPEAPAYAR
jgi:hypothetical protein